ncbi:patatin-like phospholipase family protein [Saxibacter everestensis]|uniref:Patatin-like phospholipase family protein n=1 Tax=Saxibacter everestensis TaxID=2909229 RepID=A0ABY8QV99_9MICO|nr:patatin-like phospholipase family protein [Brevibacteriaceae bacterium ZFBP1038]
MPVADLVLEGGGVKLPGLIGAIDALAEAPDPYSFNRIAGASAGAIVGALVSAGASVESMKATVLRQDFTKFQDLPPWSRFTPWLGKGLGLIFHKGMYRNDALHAFLTAALATHGVHTWSDLRQDDPDSSLPPERRYRLVVIVSDVSRGRMLRLPWDYRPQLGLDPDTQPVADAVCASAAIPFFFRPVKLPANPAVVGHRSVLCVDGGLLSNFPVGIFDRTDSAPARWPTFGIKLSGRETARTGWRSNRNTVEFAVSLLTTLINARDRIHIDNPEVAARTTFVDTSDFSSTDFDLSQQDKLLLFENGLRAGRKFLSTWDWQRWKDTYRPR